MTDQEGPKWITFVTPGCDACDSYPWLKEHYPHLEEREYRAAEMLDRWPRELWSTKAPKAIAAIKEYWARNDAAQSVYNALFARGIDSETASEAAWDVYERLGGKAFHRRK